MSENDITGPVSMYLNQRHDRYQQVKSFNDMAETSQEIDNEAVLTLIAKTISDQQYIIENLEARVMRLENPDWDYT